MSLLQIVKLKYRYSKWTKRKNNWRETKSKIFFQTQIKERNLSRYRKWKPVLTQIIHQWFQTMRKMRCVSSFESVNCHKTEGFGTSLLDRQISICDLTKQAKITDCCRRTAIIIPLLNPEDVKNILLQKVAFYSSTRPQPTRHESWNSKYTFRVFLAAYNRTLWLIRADSCTSYSLYV